MSYFYKLRRKKCILNEFCHNTIRKQRSAHITQHTHRLTDFVATTARGAIQHSSPAEAKAQPPAAIAACSWIVVLAKRLAQSNSLIWNIVVNDLIATLKAHSLFTETYVVGKCARTIFDRMQ